MAVDQPAASGDPNPVGSQFHPTGGQFNPAGGQSGPPGGLLDHLGELLSAGMEYFQARLTLAGIEAKEALLHFALIIGLLVGAVAIILFGYLFLCIALTVLIANFLGISPGWVILGLAVLHFAIAGGSVLFAVIRLKTGVFTATLAELRKDQQWMSHK
jgi:uncharacterized membrane protein YqjE